ncbi:MAG: hypothetical protein V4858_11530 [Pseudomonadota bacterium]
MQPQDSSSRSRIGLLTMQGRRWRNLLAAAAVTIAAVGTAQAQTYANVTVGGAFAPGVFGQISIGNNPPPPLLNVQPMVVGRPVYGAAPMYLHVAQEEYRDWGRHCGRYRACGHPVHFVRVEQNNRWWDRHNDDRRGRGRGDGHDNFRKYEERRGDHWHEQRGERRSERNSHRRDDLY